MFCSLHFQTNDTVQEFLDAKGVKTNLQIVDLFSEL